MLARASRCLTYLLLLIPPLVVSVYLLASFPPPPPPLPLAAHPGLDSLPLDAPARLIYSEDWISEGGYAEFPLGRSRYWLAGPEDGTKIVLIHGLSVPSLIFAPLVPRLAAAGFRVLLYDLPARGYSDAPLAAPHDAALYTTQLALLLQHVGWARTAHLVGMSMGGGIAVAFAAAFPQLVSGDVVLIASAGLLEASDLPRTAKFMSSPLVQALTMHPLIFAYLRRLAARASPASPNTPSSDPNLAILSEPTEAESQSPLGAPDALAESYDAAPLSALVRLQSAHLPGFNPAVSSSLRNGPVSGLAWAFERLGRDGRRVLVIHSTDDHTVPPAHADRIKELVERGATSRNLTSLGSSSSSSSPPHPPEWNSNTKSQKTRLRSWACPFGCTSDGDVKNERAEGEVRVVMLEDGGHALTWTHAGSVGRAVVGFLLNLDGDEKG